MLGHNTSSQDAKSHAQIPRHEDGRVSSASLVIVCHIDGHILESGPHVTIAQSDEQC